MQRFTVGLTAILLAVPMCLPAAEPAEKTVDEAGGQEIFVREWVKDDPRSHGGDGLGPVFNGSSCVTCHNQGGAGGAGGFDENVTLLSASFVPFSNGPGPSGGGGPGQPTATDPMQQTRKMLAAQVHPDFADSDTIVIHRFGTHDGHETWRTRIRNGNFMSQLTSQISPDLNVVFDSAPLQPPTFESPSSPQQFLPQPSTGTGMAMPQVQPMANFVNVSSIQVPGGDQSFPILGRITTDLSQLKSGARNSTASSFAFHNVGMQSSQRNTTALWGAGLVDRIPEAAILALAKAQQEGEGRVSGRVHRLADGRIGRFGWKAQKASLYDFTMAACAVELGLNVPGEKQAKVPYDREYEPAGLDLTKREVQNLVDYIGSLPAPAKLEPAHEGVAKHLAGGESLFASVGCAECHVRDVGEVTGVFTDFLLHDMGPDLGSVGSYGVPSVPEQDPDIPVAGTDGEAKPKVVPPTSREWRTPALWGVRDSAPYLHDGRARTLEQAIAFHGGEAAEARLRFMLLKSSERQQIVAFMKTLVAPDSVASRK